MASQNNPPITTQTLARQSLDDLLRRELKVSDPRDPQQIAAALRERYKADPRAQAIDTEARGLPFAQLAPAVAAPAAVSTSVDAEMAQARSDVERDLEELCNHTLLKDTAAELRGWAHAIKALINDGEANAPYALHSRQRDKVLGIRRQLGDYARLARLVGAYSPNTNPFFRSLATSLDETAAVLLVMLGEALANAGANGSKSSLQVPLSELQVRREAALAALRNLTNSTEAASLYQNDWQWGLAAYRELYLSLDRRGHADLRALMNESELAGAMDSIIQRAAKGTVEGLRAVGATSEIDLDRFYRLRLVADQLELKSPPLIAFMDALMLFAEAFNSSGGHRLLRIARPPLLFYGLYGSRVGSEAEMRMIKLVNTRNQLAEAADCLAHRGYDSDRLPDQVKLDKILYDVDRAIDLYALGDDNWGEPEMRAGAYGLIAQVLNGKPVNSNKKPPVELSITGDLGTRLHGLLGEITECLVLFGPPEKKWDAKTKALVHTELALQQDREVGSNSRFLRLAQAMSSACGDQDPLEIIKALLEAAERRLYTDTVPQVSTRSEQSAVPRVALTKAVVVERQASHPIADQAVDALGKALADAVLDEDERGQIIEQIKNLQNEEGATEYDRNALEVLLGVLMRLNRARHEVNRGRRK